MDDIKIKEINVKDYVTISKLPSCDYVINPYVGCTHSCMYCYARFMKRFTNHNEEWGKFIDIKVCNNPINKNKLKGKTVVLSSVTDCYNEYEEKYKITRSILEELKDIYCEVNIITKSKLIIRDIDLLKQFKKLTVSISINTTDEIFKNDMDKASSIKDRVETLRILKENGIHTVLFMSPIFPYITDWKNIIELTKDYVDEYWFENLNLRADYKVTILNYIKNKYYKYYSEYLKIYNKKDLSYWNNLSFEIKEYCNKNNIKYKNYFHHEELVKQNCNIQLSLI